MSSEPGAIQHVVEQLDTLRELISGLLEIFMSSASNYLNAELRVLTVVTTLFAPATLLTGFFGMNFVHMPWLQENAGWVWVVGLILLSGLGLIGALFWRRWWIRHNN
ncbi:MAG: hypothetical protein CGU28_17205 [Candidatus Dactylopiibacterium carminicum]|uniref:Magnesium transporter CorA n=1 Tax=Candidatus Dactylopiibacterium carminicum TaxID=857335 RepID=A0A272EMB8_9RHOO|nr:CorA family divalent cation transporter [Candidatus Dactylopiibacterium carminicum]KAF7597654.1 hypothetical protein BGI27_17635 [Candidatus Dactylopiibacterium carminicum]PAS91278.1 MAG: hypothetical protein CGU29_17345 [Candidatus Dactylopiibacterium carminicum]PAS91882.1 MAG: hypothetical protein CGU28_17205 [Candidatus Dactylopiibacterium carminicum]PAS93346.1 MAG: hypothetical protein BSR46_17685 [Candidatus Dactylopiibacterium carminicum]